MDTRFTTPILTVIDTPPKFIRDAPPLQHTAGAIALEVFPRPAMLHVTRDTDKGTTHAQWEVHAFVRAGSSGVCRLSSTTELIDGDHADTVGNAFARDVGRFVVGIAAEELDSE